MSSCHTSIASDVEHRDSGPTIKRKLDSDACKAIKTIKNEDLLINDKERMACACAKCGTMMKYSKDKRNGMWITARAVQHVKNCALAAEHLSKASEKSHVKEEDDGQKVRRNIFSAWQDFLSKLPPRQHALAVQARHAMQRMKTLLH